MAVANTIAYVIAFVVSVLVGAFGIYIGARVIVDTEDYTYAIVTALIGSLALVLFGLVPIIGTILALVAWIVVVNWRYPGGWVDAILIGLIAWIAALVALWILDLVGIEGLRAVGIPGT